MRRRVSSSMSVHSWRAHTQPWRCAGICPYPSSAPVSRRGRWSPPAKLGKPELRQHDGARKPLKVEPGQLLDFGFRRRIPVATLSTHPPPARTAQLHRAERLALRGAAVLKPAPVALSVRRKHRLGSAFLVFVHQLVLRFADGADARRAAIQRRHIASITVVLPAPDGPRWRKPAGIRRSQRSISKRPASELSFRSPLSLCA